MTDPKIVAALAVVVVVVVVVVIVVVVVVVVCLSSVWTVFFCEKNERIKRRPRRQTMRDAQIRLSANGHFKKQDKLKFYDKETTS